MKKILTLITLSFVLLMSCQNTITSTPTHHPDEKVEGTVYLQSYKFTMSYDNSTAISYQVLSSEICFEKQPSHNTKMQAFNTSQYKNQNLEAIEFVKINDKWDNARWKRTTSDEVSYTGNMVVIQKMLNIVIESLTGVNKELFLEEIAPKNTTEPTIETTTEDTKNYKVTEDFVTTAYSEPTIKKIGDKKYTVYWADISEIPEDYEYYGNGKARFSWERKDIPATACEIIIGEISEIRVPFENHLNDTGFNWSYAIYLSGPEGFRY